MIPTLTLAWSRKWRLLLVGFVSLIWLRFLLDMIEATGRGHDTWAFVWWTLLIPLGCGWAFSSILHEMLHRPSALLLPRVARRIVTGHLVVTLGFAALCACATHRWQPAVSAPTAFALSAAAFSASLPLEPGFRWAGSRVLAWFLVGAVVILARTITHWSAAAPVIVALAAFGFTAICFLLLGSRARRRNRALLPHTSYVNAIFSGPLQKARQQEKVAHQDFSWVTWSPSPRDGSVRWWLRALRFEQTHLWSRLGWLGSILLGSLVIVPVLALLARDPAGFATALLSLVSNEQRSASGGIAAALILQMMLAPMPRAGWLYPMPRRERTRVVFAGSVVQLFASVSGLALALLAAGSIAAWWTGVAYPWSGYAKSLAAITPILPFIPLLMWGRLHHDVRETKGWLATAVVVILFFGPSALRRIVFGSVSLPIPDGTLSTGLAVCLLLTALSHGVYYLALQRFHARGDLIQRGLPSSFAPLA